LLVPEKGKELSHVQFASLDEQLFGAMRSLFAQDERECTARIAGMKASVSLRMFEVRNASEDAEPSTARAIAKRHKPP
jgi:hypothetical protein